MLTFISKNLVATALAATTNSTKILTLESGTSVAGITVGGWEDSLLREWMNATLFGALPIELRSNIKSVKKLADLGSVSSTKEGYYELRQLNETDDLIWAPSTKELAMF